MLAEPLRGLVAVHSWHLDIHQDQIEWFPLGLRLFGHFARHAAVLGDLNFEIHLLEDLTKHDVDVGNVFCQKHPTVQGRFVFHEGRFVFRGRGEATGLAVQLPDWQ